MARKTVLTDVFLMYLPPFLWMGLIWHTSAIQGSGENFDKITGFDKLLHIVAYFSLCGLVTRVLILQEWSQSLRSDSLRLGAALALAFGILDEIHQAGVAGRSSSPLDLLADLAGVMLYVGVHFILKRI